MTAKTPHEGDMVRMTQVRGEVTTTITGPVEKDRWGGLRVDGVACHPAPPGWTVDVIGRALPPEPPIGSIGVLKGTDAIVKRDPDGWHLAGTGIRLHGGWPTFHERITILRSGPCWPDCWEAARDTIVEGRLDEHERDEATTSAYWHATHREIQ